MHVSHLLKHKSCTVNDTKKGCSCFQDTCSSLALAGPVSTPIVVCVIGESQPPANCTPLTTVVVFSFVSHLSPNPDSTIWPGMGSARNLLLNGSFGTVEGSLIVSRSSITDKCYLGHCFHLTCFGKPHSPFQSVT